MRRDDKDVVVAWGGQEGQAKEAPGAIMAAEILRAELEPNKLAVVLREVHLQDQCLGQVEQEHEPRRNRHGKEQTRVQALGEQEF